MDAQIYLNTGKVGEDVVVKELNKRFDTVGNTYPYEENPHGDAFPEIEHFGGLPDFIAEGDYKVYDDGKTGPMVVEIKTAGNDKFKRDGGLISLKAVNDLDENDITDTKGEQSTGMYVSNLNRFGIKQEDIPNIKSNVETEIFVKE
jgi:hypothetical protein